MGKITLKIAAIAATSLTIGSLLHTPAAGAAAPAVSEQLTCPSGFVGKSPVELRLPAWGMTWINTETRVTKDPVGYRMMVNKSDDRGTRLLMAYYDENGELLNSKWIAGKRDDSTMRLQDFGFDQDGRAVAAWTGERLSLARFNYDGSPDTSFSDDGKVERGLPSGRSQPVSVTWNETGITVLIQSEPGAVATPGYTHHFLNDGTEDVTRTRTAAANRAYPFATWFDWRWSDGAADNGRQAVVSGTGDLLWQAGDTIMREDRAADPVNGWADNGTRATANTDRMFGQWHYDDDADVLTYLTRLADNRSILTRLPRDGGAPLEQIEINSQPWSIAQFGDGTMIGLGTPPVIDPSRYVLSNVRTGQTIDEPWGELVSHLQEINPDLIGYTATSGFGVWDEDGSHARFYMAPPRVTNGVSGSLSDQVRRIYQALTLAPPNASELEQWRRYLAAGHTVEDLTAHLSEIGGAMHRYDALDNWTYIRTAYSNLLGRDAEPQMAGYWQYELDSGRTRSDLLANIADSEEFAAGTGIGAAYQQPAEGAVHRLYLAYFDRSADVGGLCYWLNTIRTNPSVSVGAVADEFAASAEFAQTYGVVSNATFVDLVYRNVLERSADADGHRYWTNLLSNGLTRGQLMLNFSDSAEFVLKTDIAR